MFKLVILIFCLFIFPSSISAQVVINEISVEPEDKYDWLELFAIENTDVSSWNLSDETGVFETFASGTILDKGSYKIVTQYQRFGNEDDTIYLYDNNGNQIDSISYGQVGEVCVPSKTGSIARIPDANSHYDRLLNHTKGLTNGESVTDPCPSPTTEPPATSVPTSTPTKIPSPTKTPSPSPTNKPVLKTSTPTRIKETATEDIEDVLDNTKEAVLGINEIGDSTGTPTPESKIADEGKRSIPLSAGLFVILGLVFISFAFYQLLRSRKKGYNFGSVENTDKQE